MNSKNFGAKKSSNWSRAKLQLQIITVGQKMPGWVETACADYLKRMPRELKIEITSIALAQRKSGASVEQLKQQEASQIIKKLPTGSYSIALDERGKQWSSIEWSRQLEYWMREHPRVNLIIGGPDGLGDECREACAQTLALGAMTMPHTLVRVVLIEQLYRAWTLLNGHPYHRE
jgi:23S rRNA (pseudouridine1915-N3)-methyltransferase